MDEKKTMGFKYDYLILTNIDVFCDKTPHLTDLVGDKVGDIIDVVRVGSSGPIDLKNSNMVLEPRFELVQANELVTKRETSDDS